LNKQGVEAVDGLHRSRVLDMILLLDPGFFRVLLRARGRDGDRLEGVVDL
jgi:hypothetical protein